MQHLNELKWGLGLAETNIRWLIRRISPSRHCKTKDNSLSWTWRMNRWFIKLLRCCIVWKEKKYKHIKIRARKGVLLSRWDRGAPKSNFEKKQKKNKSTNFSRLIQISKKHKTIYSCLLPSAKNAHFERRHKQGACHWVERVQASLWHHKMT